MVLVRLIPVLTVMGGIFFLSHQPGDTLPLPAFPEIDKLCHAAVYGVLALSVLWALGPEGSVASGGTALKTVLVCVLYGVGDEVHQMFVPLRSASVLDLLADGSGAMIVSTIWLRSRVLRRVFGAWNAALARKM